ncbi:MAG: efflux RND transporter permease subunit [Planctomycetota bacterium]
MKISLKAMDQPKIVLLGTACILLTGILCLYRIPVELTPKINIPVFFVVIPYPGAAPEDVETQITKDLEKKLNALKSLDYLHSISAEGYCSVIVHFQDNTNLQEAKRDLRELVDEAKVDFPEEAEEAIIKDIDFSNIPLLFVTIHGQESAEVLKELAERFRDELTAVPGVSEIDLFGGLEREIHIDVDFNALKEYQLSLGQVEQALRAQNINIPGGHLNVGTQEFLIRSIGEFQSLDDISNTVIQNAEGKVTLLKHIAKVKDSNKKIDTLARINGDPGVTLIIQRELGINTLQTIKELRKKIEWLSRSLSNHIHVTISFDQSDEIGSMVQQLGSTIIYSSILVVLCLIWIMGFRNALLVSTAIPTSLLFGFICFQLAGISISGITLFSLILISGMVVDGAIVVGENIYRHIENDLDGINAAKLGIHEVGEAVISADLTTIAAFLPMIFIAGILGQFLAIMPQVVAYTLLGSMIIDHFALPVLASMLMKKSKPRKIKILSWPLDMLKILHMKLLHLGLRFPWTTLWICFVLFLIAMAMALFGFLGYEFMPNIDRGRFSINIEMPRGTSIFKTDEVTREVEKWVRKIPAYELESYVTTIGQTNRLNADILEGGGSGPEFGKVTVKLVDHKFRTRTLPEILDEYRSWLKGKFPGVQIRFYVQKDGPPVGAAMAIRIQGEDMNQLNTVATRMQQLLSHCPGASDIQSDYRANAPQYRIQIDRIKAGAYGITALQISTEVARAFLGKEVGKITLNDEKIEIRLQLEQSFRTTKESLEKLFVPTSTGSPIPIAQVAKVEEFFGLAAINRRDLKRTVTVRCETAHRWSSDDILLWLKQEMKTFYVPSKITLILGGETEERDKSLKSAKQVMGISVLLILLILTAQFNSFVQPFIIIMTIPMSIIGVVFGLYFLDQRFGFLPFIGIIALSGIVVNDAIVLVDFTNLLRRGGLPLKEAIIRSSQLRLRAVMLTTITTVFGLIPLALNWGGGGLFWAPLAWTIICGISVATLLTLVVIPVMYFLFSAKSLVPSKSTPTINFEEALKRSQLQELGLLEESH